MIPYFYTWQIFFFFIVNVIVLTKYRSKITWKRYLSVMLINCTWGIIQINDMENYASIPAWGFYEGVSYWGTAFGHLYWDDIGFIFVCTSLFYYFLFKTKNIPDIIPKKWYIWLVCIFILVEAQLYHICGDGGKTLVLIYTLIPVLLFTFYCIIKNHKPNITQAVSFLGLVLVVSLPWEILNDIFKWWFYNKESNVFSNREFIAGGNIPMSISPQFTISGWTVMFSIWTVFCTEKHTRITA